MDDIREQYRALVEETKRQREEDARFWRNLGIAALVSALALMTWLEWMTS